MKLMFTVLLLVILAGCDSSESKRAYIKTERGLLPYGHGYCILGMLTNNDRHNIVDENSKPLTCTGYADLTASQAENWVD